MWPRGAILKTSFALGVESAHPLVRALAADPHGLRDMGNGHPLVADTINEQASTPRRETGVTVRHEDLLDLCEAAKLHTARRSSHVQGPVTNVSAEYN